MGKSFNEEELSARLEADDPRAFDYVFDLFYASIAYFAGNIVSNKEEGEDIAMETFRKFWVLRANFKTLNNIKAFLYITARNSCLNYLKSAHNQRTGRNPMPNDDTTGYEQGIENMMIESETIKLIYKEVKKLPKKCRQIFEMTYFDGFSNREIAKMLGISTSTITSQRSRAMLLLKENLKNVEW